MQKIVLLLLAVVVTMTSCGDDDFIMLTNTLHFDSDNDSSPAIPAGDNEMAIKLEAEDLATHIGKQLTQITFYGYDAPDACSVHVYEEGTNGRPGNAIYSADVLSDFSFGWITHTLSTPIEIDGNDIWISVSMTQSGSQQVVGCDAGPNQAGGDWLFQSSDNQWRTFRSRTNEAENVNWNIRGIVE